MKYFISAALVIGFCALYCMTAHAANVTSSGRCPSGACSLGEASTTTFTITTDGTGNAELVLPDDSVGGAEIVSSSVNFSILGRNAVEAEAFATMTGKIVLCGQLVDAGSTNTWVGPAAAEYLGNGTEFAIGGTACDALDSEANSAGADEAISAAFPPFKVTGMQCVVSSDPTNDVVITLNSAAAVLTPSVTCTIAGTGAAQGCSSITTTTTDIAAGATISAAIVYSEDLDLQDVWCQVYMAHNAF
jgi:hypothetical protein